MKNKLKFKAIVEGEFYDTDPEGDQDITFTLNKIDVLDNGDIGVSIDYLYEVVKKLELNFNEVENLIDAIKCNSLGTHDYITMTPVKILQCLGSVDKNNKLVFEGDILHVSEDVHTVDWNTEFNCFMVIFQDNIVLPVKDDWFSEGEIVGNVYEDLKLTKKYLKNLKNLKVL